VRAYDYDFDLSLVFYCSRKIIELVGNGATRRTSFVVYLVSGVRLFGFGNALRIRVYGCGFGHGFVFGNVLRIRAYGLGFRHGIVLGDSLRFRAFCLDVWEAFPVQECSRRKGSGRVVRRAGKDVKGFYIRRGPMRML